MINNYQEFNKVRNSIIEDFDKIQKKLDKMATFYGWKTNDQSQEVLAQIENKVYTAKRQIKYNNLLWQENLKNE